MLTPNDLYEIRKIVVASKLLDSKAFDAELSKMESSIQTLAKTQVAEAAFANDKFIAQAAKMQDELDAKETQLQATVADIATRTAQLDIKQTEYNKTAADVGAQLDELATLTKSVEKKTEAMYKKANSRIEDADKRDQEIAAREQALAQGQADLAAKLAALKAISA